MNVEHAGPGVVAGAGGLVNLLNGLIVVVLLGLFFHHVKQVPVRFRMVLLVMNAVLGPVLFLVAKFKLLGVAFALLVLNLLVFAFLNVWAGTEEKRIGELEEQLIDALLILSGSLKAGRSLEQGFDLVQKSLSPPISQEFMMVLQDQGLGVPFDKALRGMLERVPSRDFRLFVTATLFQRETGGNIISLYDEIISAVAERRKVRGKMDAMSVQGRYSGYIIAGLPIGLFVVLLFVNPAYVGVFFDGRYPAAETAFVLAIVLEVTGVLSIRGILNRKVG